MGESQFLPHNGIYLLNHSVGRPPRSARESVIGGFFDPWESGDAEVWPVWLEKIEAFRCALAKLLNAQMVDFCPQVNLSSALGKIIYSLPRTAGKNVISMTEQDFPSMGFVLGQAHRDGFELRMIPGHLDSTDLNVWREYLTDEVCCTLVTQVYSNTGVQLPVAGITRLAKERDIISIVDICQAVGVVPINLQSWQADFVLGSCVKWLCGGPGAAYLWVNPDIVERCEPIDVGWFSHENPFEFDINDFRYAQGALRFWGGTPSVIPFVLAKNSITLLDGFGIDQLRRHNLELNDMILAAVPPEVVVTPLEHTVRGGTIVLNFGDRQAEIEKNLHRNRVRFDTRSMGLRLSPHIYNTASEMDIVLSCLSGEDLSR